MEKSKQIICTSEWIDTLQRERKVCIYLPPHYYTSNEHYPTLIMQDGQNMSVLREGSPVKWDFDIYQNNHDDIILVTIDSDCHRSQEYAPFLIDELGMERFQTRGLAIPKLVEGPLYVKWIVDSLLPKLQLRTSYYAIGGSSMGANISLYAIATYPHIFRYAALISPAYWFSCDAFKTLVETSNFKNNVIFTSVGTNENGLGLPFHYLEGFNTINQALQTKDVKVIHKIIEDGEHNETAWAKLVKDIVETIKK